MLLFNELNFDVNEMKALVDEHIFMLNVDQKAMYDHVIQGSSLKQGRFFFVYGYGGTDKTFL